MIYLKNAPSQAVQPVKPIRKKISTEITNITKNISSKIQF